MKSLNQKWFLEINSLATQNHTLDFIMVVIAKFLPYLFILLLFYLWFNDKQNEALFAGFNASLGIGINLLIGLFYFHSRPFMDNLGVTLLFHKSENSFPSDHTTFVISISLILFTFKSTKILGIITTILALWCGVARVYVGVHYPFDIVGSIFTALIATFIITFFKSKFLTLNNFLIFTYKRICCYEKI